MQTGEINFRRNRDFGDLLGDTFAFLKQEFRFFSRVMLFYAGPFVLLSAIASAWFSSGVFSMMRLMMRNNPTEILAEFGLKLLVYMVAAIVSNTFILCVVYSYIGLYNEKGKDGFVQEEVWFRVGRKFFPVLGIMIVVSLIIMIGSVLCLIPGIFFAVSLSLILASSFYEKLSFGDSFSRSMSLVNRDWWFTLGLGIVLYLLLVISSYIFVLPSSVYSIFMSLNSLKGNTPGEPDIIYMVLVAIGTFGTSLLSCVPHITLSLLYFSLIEKRESPGLLSKIDKINNPDKDQEEALRF
jgi:hypothetical protein